VVAADVARPTAASLVFAAILLVVCRLDGCLRLAGWERESVGVLPFSGHSIFRVARGILVASH